MGFVFRQRVTLGRSTRLNISGRGVSASAKVGPVTFNTRGRATIRLAKGLSFRIR